MFDEKTARAWMTRELQGGNPAYLDCEEVNRTMLAENCAHAFDVSDEGGPLDDPDHWIWDAAHEVAESWEQQASE